MSWAQRYTESRILDAIEHGHNLDIFMSEDETEAEFDARIEELEQRLGIAFEFPGQAERVEGGYMIAVRPYRP